MRSRSLVLLLALLSASIPEQMTAAASEPLAVGVADFQHHGYGAAGLASTARGLVETELARRPWVRLVERARLADLLDEIGFQQSGMTDPEGLARAGATLNLRVLLFGEVSRGPQGSYRLALRSVDVATGQVLSAEQIPIPRGGPPLERAVRLLAVHTAVLAAAGQPAAMVTLPAATFPMGSAKRAEERPVHSVSLPAFRLHRTEVTRGALYAFRRSRGEVNARDLPEQPQLPAGDVSWQEASAYCGWLGKRLPTEAEWERAARGPEARTYPWGEQPPSPARARFAASGPVAVHAEPASATPEGVLHLAGNVAEWVADWWDPTYYARSPGSAPQGPATGDFRVVRGGGYGALAGELRGAARGFHNPLRGRPDIGFRCAESTPAAP